MTGQGPLVPRRGAGLISAAVATRSVFIGLLKKPTLLVRRASMRWVNYFARGFCMCELAQFNISATVWSTDSRAT